MPDEIATAPHSQTLIIAHCDGGSRGNPGPAGFGAVLEDASGRVLARLSEYLGKRTNNYAEYSALLAVLAWTLDQGYRRLRVVADSELMVRQMQGRYKVNSPDLRPLWEEAQRRVRRLEHFEMQHTLRGGNKLADQLANEAMDRGMGRSPQPTADAGPKSAVKPVPKNPVPTGPKSAAQTASAASSAASPQTALGFVKNGVVHFVEGSLPDGVFVRISRQ